MLSKPAMDCLNLITVDDFKVLNRIPRVMKVPGVISEFEDTPAAACTVPPIPVERRIIVSNQLPIRCYRDSSANKWCFELDSDSLVLQLKDGFPPDTEVCYVGTIKAEIEFKDQEDISQILFDKFRCLPVFLNVELQNKFYHGFCKHYLWPLFHYMLPLSPTHSARFDGSQWQAYVMANKMFADKVVEVLNPDEDSVGFTIII